MELWYITLGIAVAVFIGIIILLYCLKLLKRRPYYTYQEDELIKVKDGISAKDRLFFTHGETRKYIQRYAFCVSEHEKYVICNYNKIYEKLSFFVVCYNKKKQIVGVYVYKEQNPTGTTSKLIPVSHKTESVNIIMGMVDNVVINNDLFVPLKSKRIALYSALSGLAVFAFLYALRHLVAWIVCQSYLYSFLYSMYDIFIILGCLVAGLLVFLFAFLRIRRKNARASNGGVVEYEFI